MKRVILICILAMGCNGGGSKSEQNAQPTRSGPEEKILSVIGTKPAATSPEARTAIDRLLQSHTRNNVSAIKAFRNCIIRRKGEMNQSGNYLPAECVDHFAWPESYRANWSLGGNSPKIFAKADLVSLFAPHMGHTQPTPLSAAETANNLEDIRATWMTVLVPLLDPKDTIAAIETDTPAKTTAIRVWVGAQPPLLLVMNADTGLLSKILFHKGSQDNPETWSFVLSEHKITDGVLLPGRVVFTPGGQAGAIWPGVEYEAVASFPAGTFEKP